MKKILPLLITLIYASALFSESSTSGLHQKDNFRKFILMPADDTVKDKNLMKFITEFRQAIKDKNIVFLKKYTSENIIWSFGDESGSMKNFLKSYGLDSVSYKESVFWQEMDRILSLGGIYYNGEKTSIAFPYIFVNFPVEDYDSYTYAAVTGKNVNVRKNPDINSPVVDTISYEIVKVLNNPSYDVKKEIIASKTGVWVNVKTSSGNEGYVFSYYLHSPIGYRAVFEKEKGKWMLRLFISGD